MSIKTHKDVESIVADEKEIENLVNSLAKRLEKDYNDKDFIMRICLFGSNSAYNEKYGNLPYVGILKPSVYS